MTVLILSSSEDAHARAVTAHLDTLGSQYVVAHLSSFGTSATLTYSPSGDDTHNFIGLGDGLKLSDISAVWFRRPGGPRSMRMPEPWVERMIESEYGSALGGMFRGLDCIFVNHPGRDRESLFKIFQLKEAAKLGFRVPDTIVTNEPDKAREFFEKHNGAVIYKLVGEGTNFCFPLYEVPSGIPTVSCKPSDLNHFDQVRFAPHLFQRRIDKVADVRVTIVGAKLFAIRIESQQGKSKLDWRLDYDVPMTKTNLPDDLSWFCLELMRRLKLNYAAFDFCLDTEGEYVFLELNCAGQYLWMESRTDLPISHELALLLAGKSEPIVRNPH